MFSRAETLLGHEAMQRLANLRVILFGCGGVGSWCAEGLVRTGLRRLTIVDSDCVDPSNINRQLMATTLTIGQPKVLALKKRLMELNPEAEITAVRQVYCEDTADEFPLDEYDFVIDAIDSLKDKVLLILRATSSRATLLSSMGAALKSDPSKIAVAEFWQVKGCPLARALRYRFKRAKTFPRRKFLCVYSPELLENKRKTTQDGLPQNSQDGQQYSQDGQLQESEPSFNGSLVHITAIYGFTLAGSVINSVRI